MALLSGGTTDADDRPFEPVVQLIADELPGQDAVLVERPLPRRRQPPGVHQLIAAIDAEDDVRVADVDDEKVGHGG